MAYDYYLKLEGLDGECTDFKHEKWIQIVEFSYDVKQRGGGSGTADGAYGSVNLSDLSITKAIDATTPQLHQACITHQRYKTGSLELCQAAKEKHPFMKYLLTDVSVASISPSGEDDEDDAGGSYPMEVVTLRYGSIEWVYTPLSEKGQPGAARKFFWDVKSYKD